MASPANKGGIGGKFRRRPFRRPQSTPYARPPTALRGVRGCGRVEEGGGWFSKLVDPASRLITNGAAKLFSSMFRQRLTAPAKESEEDHQSRQDVSQPTCTIPSSEVQNDDMKVGNQTNNSGSGGIAELEQLVKQKTFTRVEFDRLAGLLHSRTVENTEHETNDKKREKAGQSVSENGIVGSKVHENLGIGSSKIHENVSVPAGGFTSEKQIVKDEVASPAELAKAYMGSRPCKVSTSVGNLRSQVFQEVANLPIVPSISKQLDLSVAPRSVIHFSGIPEHPEDSYHTARATRPPGRSAIYRMSRSPYFKVNHNNQKVWVGESSRDGYCHPSSSQWTPSAMKSSGKQVLKRGSAALSVEFGSVGPIRRIRQKSNLMSPSKEASLSLSGKYLSSPSTPLLKDISKGSMSVQKPLLLDEWKYSSSGSQTENGISSSAMPPPQSSEKVQNLFQQLDKLLPSPKEKSSELKTIARDDSPSKLTLGMLHGSTLRSMDDVNSSKFFNMQENDSLDTASDSHLPDVKKICSQKQDRTEENGPSKSIDLKVRSAYKANGVSNAFIPSKDAMCVGRSENAATSKSVALPLTKKPAFRITAPEDSLELDDDEYPPSPSTTPNSDADKMESKHHNANSETTISVKPPTSSSHCTPVSSSISFRKSDEKAFVQSVVTEKDNGFVFPVASDPCNQSQPPPTPIMLTSQLDKPEVKREHAPSPIFSFGSKDVNTSTISSATVSVNNTSSINIGELSGSELPSATRATTTLAEVSTIDNSEKQMSGDIFNLSANTVPSGISTSSTPATFAFGAAAAPIQSNGSLHASSSTCPAPSTASIPLSEGPVSAVFANSTSSSISSSVSFAASTFSIAPTFQFGSDMSTTALVSFSQQLDKSNSITAEANSVKASPFGTSSSTAQDASSVIPSNGSSSSPDAATSVSIFGSTNPSGSSFSVAISTASPCTGSSLLGFNASTQPIGSSPSFSTSSQNSTGTIFGASGGSSGSSPSLANNSSQNSTATTFGVTGSSLFGTQSTLSGSGASQMSQGSTSQFGSFTSSPSFGWSNSSSGSFCTSPFGSVTSGANPLSLSSGTAFSSCANNSLAFAPVSTTIPFGSSSQATTSSIFTATSNSNISLSSGLSFGSSTSGSILSPFTVGSSSGSGSLTVIGSSSSGSSSSSFTFGLSSGSSTSPFTVGSSSGSGSSSFTFGLSSGSSTLPFTVGSSSGSGNSSFIFGASSGTSSSPFTMGSSSGPSSSPFTMGSSSGSSSSPFAFDSSLGSVFSNSSSPPPAFGALKPFGFSSGSPGNDQMNVEDSMTDVTNNAQAPFVPAFGQPANPPTSPGFMFGSHSVQPVVPPAFQFGGLQNPSVPQNPSPFQSAGNAEFNPAGSFSLGSGGGEKSARKFVKVKRGLRKR